MPPSARECLYAEIQRHAGNPDVTGAPVDAILVGFLVVAEWETPDGERWISKNSGDHGRDLPSWRERGYAADVVYGEWNVENEED